MATLMLPDFLKRFQLQLLGVATDDVLPGAVVDKARRGYLPLGHLGEILTEEPASYWETEQNRANIVYGSIEQEIGLGGKASLSQFGVEVSGGLSRATAATLTITGI